MVYSLFMARPHREPRFPSTDPDPAESAWIAYLRSLEEPSGPLSAHRVHQIESFWEALQEQFARQLQPPYATATETGGLAMTWDSGPHHFEIEILADGRYDWFYLDRSSGERLGEEDHLLGTCSSEMTSRLRLTIV